MSGFQILQVNREKENKTVYIAWKTIARAKPYHPATKKCNLCIKEKYFIIFKPEMATLNRRLEITYACRHRRKLLLENA